MKPISRCFRAAGFCAPALALAAGLTALSPHPARAAGTTRHTLSGEKVSIYNLVGTVEIVRGTGGSVVAEVTLNGPDADRLQVAEGPIDGRSTLRVIYPGNRVSVPQFGDHTTSTIHVRDDGTFGDSHRGGRKVVLTGSGDGIEASADIRISVPAGKRLDVNWGHGRASATDVIADLAFDGAGLPVAVTGLKGLLAVDVGSGDIRVSKSTASVDIDTGSGDVDLVEIQGQSLRVDTGSGAVSANGVKGDAISISTGSGGIDVSGASAPSIQLETGSGEVTVALTGKLSTLSVESGSGDVSVTLPKSVGAQLSIETGSGGIESELAIETKMRSRHELVGRVGDGAGQIAIETGSGTVTLRQGRP
jgi:DUF4097 and DUF4098 domain-containing protein YvlB